MTEVFVLCGGAKASQSAARTVQLDINAPVGHPHGVNLNIAHITRRMIATPADRFLDLLEIAAYVYSADQFVGRGGRQMAGMGRHWRREFQFVIPVRDRAFWDQRPVREMLENTLRFLSDDEYRFHFAAATTPRSFDSYLDLNGDGPPAGFVPDRVALFSGGLDSLAGAATALFQRQESLALVSHHASNKIWGRQTELVESLRTKAPGKLFHVGVTVTKGTREANEYSQRTRSFLFASLAFVVATLFEKDEITFYENGIVSLNLPIAEHILGSRATRTTHPRVLSDFARLFSAVGDQQFHVTNPLFWSTKTEVLSKLADAGCAELIGRSFSCSHVRLATTLGQQCGICTQCLDRRFAVLAAGMKMHDPAEGYRVDLLTGERHPGPELTLAESYVLAALRYEELSESAFYARHGEALRAVRFIPGAMEENASHIHNLHQRHGRAVRQTVDAAIQELTTKEWLNLSPRCLLSLLRAPFGSPAIVHDAVANEPSIETQANALTGPDPVTRPIVLNLDRDTMHFFVAGGVAVGGAGFRLLDLLVQSYFEDLSSGKSADERRFIPARKLGELLKIDEQTVRQRVHRIRSDMTSQFLQKLNQSLQTDDVIESDGTGYRLSPHLAIRSAAYRPSQPDDGPDVTSDPQMSRAC